MKKIAIITGAIVTVAAMFTSCGSKREPGKVYMPDMAYSRAYETYAERDSTKFTADQNNKGGLIFYNAAPVAGTMKRGEELPYTLPNDTTGYKLSATVKSPLTSFTAADSAEAGRLFNINCAICHGAKAEGNGPIASSGKIGGIANLTLDSYVKMADGTMFHSITYGRNLMGSYASQLDRKQRWMLVKYIRTLQPKPTVAAAPASTDSTAATPAAPKG
ncbi:MAG: cytochrome c [Bacteroidetes bacterium]|nr:cytochrome c [Bacteroidota bacterium]